MRAKMILPVLVAVLCLQAIALQAAEIPLGISGDIYTVPVQVNRSITMQFLVDPGEGVVVIPLSVLRELIRNGSVTESDVIGIGAAELADASLHLTAKVRLRELRIGDTVVANVTAAVSPGLSRPLLGQSFLQRFASVTFDNRRRVLILSNESASPVAQAPAAAWAPYPQYPPAVGPYTGGSYAPPGYAPGYGR